jgi:hypothetical protein
MPVKNSRPGPDDNACHRIKLIAAKRNKKRSSRKFKEFQEFKNRSQEPESRSQESSKTECAGTDGASS